MHSFGCKSWAVPGHHITGRAQRRSCERFARYARYTDKQNDRFTDRQIDRFTDRFADVSGEVELREDSVEALLVTAALLQLIVTVCCYRLSSGEVELREDSVEALLATAGLLQLPEVVEACCRFLMRRLQPTNCLGIRQFADTQACEDLYRVANNYVMVSRRRRV